jgi:dTDP-4-dehydrorhamnose 3,5-epimerase
VIDLQKHGDDRGFFARVFCQDEFADHGLPRDMVQMNLSYSAMKGTVRGLHYQVAPHEEAKYIRCTRGAVYDVTVDVRPSSPTFKQWMGVELTQENYRMVYVPEGCAHGYLTLVDDSEVNYQVSAFYAPEAERGLRYDDPAIAIEWPTDVRVVSEKDRSWPAFEESVRASV